MMEKSGFGQNWRCFFLDFLVKIQDMSFFLFFCEVFFFWFRCYSQMLRTDRGLVFFFTIIFGIRVSFEERKCYWINDWMGI